MGVTAVPFDPPTPPDSLTAMNHKLDQVLEICQQLQAHQVLPFRTKVGITFAGATFGGFLASFVTRLLFTR